LYLKRRGKARLNAAPSRRLVEYDPVCNIIIQYARQIVNTDAENGRLRAPYKIAYMLN